MADPIVRIDEHTIVTRHAGRLSLDYRDEHGERRRKRLYSKTAEPINPTIADLVKRANEILGEENKLKPKGGPRMPLGAFLAEAIEEGEDITQATKNKRRTLLGHPEDLKGGKASRTFLFWARSQGIKRLGDLSRQKLLVYFQHLENRKLALSTRKTHRAVISRAIQYALEMEYLGQDPMPKSRRRGSLRAGNPQERKDQRKKKSLTELEVKRIFRELKTGRTTKYTRKGPRGDATLATDYPSYLRSAFTFMLDTGARRGEACNLTWRDIHFASGFVTLRGKTGPREVPMTERVEKLLTELKKNSASDSVFLTTGSRTLQPSALTRAAGRLFTQLGIKKPCVHCWRHTYGFRLAKAGVPANQIQALMGHTDISTTGIYLTADTRELGDTVRGALKDTA